MAFSDTSSSSSSSSSLSSSSSRDSTSSDSSDESDSVEVIFPQPKRRRRNESLNSTHDSDEASESDLLGELSSDSGGDDQSSQSEGKSSDDDISIADHKTLWKTLHFTDLRDSRDFGPFWKTVRPLKYNASSLTKLELPTENPGFPDDAWDRLGWYIWNNCQLECIVFKNCEYITDEEIRRIFGGGKRWRVRGNILSVSFSGCSFGRAGVKSMIPFLQSSVGIKWLSMRGNKIESEGFKLIAKSSAGRAIFFDFAKCGIDDFASLTGCRFPKLKGIGFNSNKCGDDGAEIIANTLMKNSPQLERLRLSHNRIGDGGAKAIANVLASHKTLNCLEFNKNDLSIEGISSFSKALRNNHTLKILDVSSSTVGWNDTCKTCCDLQYRLEINKIYEGDPKRAELTKSTAEKHYSTNPQEVDDEPGLLCPICTEKKKDFFVFWPCVHKICSDCNRNFVDARCHTCRKHIAERRRMY